MAPVERSCKTRPAAAAAKVGSHSSAASTFKGADRRRQRVVLPIWESSTPGQSSARATQCVGEPSGSPSPPWNCPAASCISK